MSFLSPALAVSQRILRELAQNKRSLFFWLSFPVVVMLLSGLIFADRSGLTFPEALPFSAPASLVGVAFFFSGVGGTVAVLVAEREQKTLQRLLLSPLSGPAYFSGIFLAQLAIAAGQTVFILSLVYFCGARLQGSWLLSLTILVLSFGIYSGMGFMGGTLVARRTQDINTLIASFGIPLLILGGAFFPSSIFPPSLKAIAVYNPVFHMTEALTAVWSSGQGWQDLKTELAILTFFLLSTWGGGAAAYNRLLNQERQGR